MVRRSTCGRAALAGTTDRTMLCFGTHVADFNTIEYMQRLRVSRPCWQAAPPSGISRVLMVVNANEAQIDKLTGLLDMPAEIELACRPDGQRGARVRCEPRLSAGRQLAEPFCETFRGRDRPWTTVGNALACAAGLPRRS